jgi:hypothetical protein
LEKDRQRKNRDIELQQLEMWLRYNKPTKKKDRKLFLVKAITHSIIYQTITYHERGGNTVFSMFSIFSELDDVWAFSTKGYFLIL